MVPVSSTLMDDPYLVCSSVASWGGGGGVWNCTHTHFYFDGRPLSGMLTASSLGGGGGGGYGVLLTINVILEVLLW